MERPTIILIDNLATTNRDIIYLQERIANIQKCVGNSINTLQQSATINSDLTKLDSGLKLMSTVLSPFTVLPSVGTALGVVKKSIDVIEKVVHPIKYVSDKVESAVKPVRNGLSQINNKITTIQTPLSDSKEYTSIVRYKFKDVNDCAVSKNNTQIISMLDAFSIPINPVVTKLNNSIDEVVYICDAVNCKLGQIEQILSPISKISKDLNIVTNVLNDINKALNPLRSALDQKITVPYSVKVKTKLNAKNWMKGKSWKWTTSSQNFTFTVHQILNGINSGIDSVNDALMKGAKDVLNSLGLKLPSIPTIPGLNELSSLENIMQHLDVLRSLDDLYDELHHIIDNLNSLNIASLTFNIECK